MTVLDVLQSTAAYFKKREIENPRLNAEHLVAHVVGLKRLELYLQFDRDLTEKELGPLRELVRRRGQGEPLQHLLGTVEFCGRTFLCDGRALVPRPETEQLVELVMGNCPRRNSADAPNLSQFPTATPPGAREFLGVANLLDVGTGSGVIALSLAAQLPASHVVASDVSEEALALAQENAARLGIHRVHFVLSDLLEKVEGKFDVIVANLPYIAEGERPSLSREVLHDPAAALFAGEKGDELMRALIEAAPNYLQADGLLALEIGINQQGPLVTLLSEKNFHDITPKKDYAGVTRFLLARYG
jgi:release factor glutamine methyltransferase